MMRIWISIFSQSLELYDENGDIVRRYQVSTALRGAGERRGSHCTPRGRHLIRAKIGAGAPDNLRRPAAWLQIPGFLAALGRECRLRSAGWDALISHWLLPCGLIGALAGRGRPHLAVAHSSDVHLLARHPALGVPAMAALAARSRCRLLLTSEALRPRLLGLARHARARRLVETAPVLRMGIPARALAVGDPEQRRRRRAALGLGPEEMLLLFVGRLVPVKGVELLLEACAGLAIHLVVLGDGPERSALQRRACARGLSAHFLGEQSAEARDEWLAAADLLVLPSLILPDGRTESAPLILLEAMAAGLPVVATRVGGNAELIRNGVNGLLVPPGEVEPLREAMAGLLVDPRFRRRLGREARRTAATHTWEDVGPLLRALLEEL
jgi:glycosyltransferase involved in cell wall biosynthesis